MATPKLLFPIALLVAGAAATVSAATFAVRPDRDLVHTSDAVVIATPIASYATPAETGGIETVTPMAVEEVIKGDVTGTAIDVVEPGGVYGGNAMIIAGAPRFAEGRRVLLFLMKTGEERWSVLDLVVGKFTFAEDRLGQRLLVRDEDEIVGVDGDLQPHRETRRSAERFLDFVRAEAHGQTGANNYSVPKAELTEPTAAPHGRLGAAAFQVIPLIAPYTATSYTMTISGSLGSRWNVFPNGVNVYMGSTQEPGAPGGGATAVQTAINSWDGDCASNVNYVYAGVDDGTHTQGLHGADGRNTVLFERDLSTWGIPAFSCSGSGYSGTRGIGGITSAGGNNTVSGETFVTTQEGDVEMNRGIANCSLLLNSGDWNSAVTHEVGHTLGFRHADQNRASSGSCSSDATLECASSAIMTAFVTRGVNAALQTWDQHAVQAVYPGGSCGCTAPTVNISASSTSITPGQNVTLSSTTTGGVTGYQWYIGTSPNTAQPIGGATGPSTNVAPTTTTSYWLRVTNSCGSANSNTITITVTSTTPARVKNDFNGDGKADLIWRNASSGDTWMWLMNGNVATSTQLIGNFSSAWIVAAVADFNNDGRADIVWRNTSTGDTWLWLMNGATVTSSQLIGNIGTTWSIAAAADFNNDGKADLVWRTAANGDTWMWLMNGAVATSSQSIGTVSTNWIIAAAADFNNDGRADLVWRNTTTGDTWIWLMNGPSVTSSQSIGAVAPNWIIAAAADFNNDGKADLVWRNTTTGDTYLWFMNGTAVSQTALIGTINTSWIVAAASDFNGDGNADLVWRNTSNGDTWLWLMNGANASSTQPIGTIGTAWSIVPKP